MMNRQQIDQIAWQTLHQRPRPDYAPPGLGHGNRPANYSELNDLIASGVEFEIAWGEFLHEFFLHRTPGFFAKSSPKVLSPEYRALLAGVAEYLAQRFEMPVPAWVFEPQYYLAEEWDILSELMGDVTEYRDERRSRSHETFLKRNVIFEPRSLITL